MRAFAILLTVGSLVASWPLGADDELKGYWNGNQISTWCGSNKEAERIACLAYLAGVADTKRMLYYIASKPEEAKALRFLDFCIPQGVSVEQLRRVFEKQSRKIPEVAHWPGPVIVSASIRNSFPCDR